MKKLLLTLMLSCACLFVTASPVQKTSCVGSGDVAGATQINDTTIQYVNVDKIEICQNADTNLILIYNGHGELVWAQYGSFKIDLPYGDYRIVSNIPFTRVESKTIVEPLYFR